MIRRQPFAAIINPAAGGGRCGQRAPGALAALQAQGVQVEPHYTQAPGDATRIARELVSKGVRHFIAAGGDGTSFEILNGVSAQLQAHDPEERIALGFLPLGTGNSFLKDFGPGTEQAAIDALVQARARPCDVLRLEHEAGELHYLNLLSLGFVADICTLTNRHFKALGTSGYALGVLVALAKLQSRMVRMRLDGAIPWEQAMVFVSVCNSRFTGGSMMMAPYADTADGFADVIVCGPMDRITLLKTFPKIFRGEHVHHPAIRASRARSLEFFEPQPIDLMIDGEVLRRNPKRISVRPSALEVFV